MKMFLFSLIGIVLFSLCSLNCSNRQEKVIVYVDAPEKPKSVKPLTKEQKRIGLAICSLLPDYSDIEVLEWIERKPMYIHPHPDTNFNGCHFLVRLPFINECLIVEEKFGVFYIHIGHRGFAWITTVNRLVYWDCKHFWRTKIMRYKND